MKKTILWITASFAIAAAAAACSPTQGSFKNSSAKQADVTLKNSPSPSPSPSSSVVFDPENELNGDWICKSGQSCPYSLISISKNGDAAAVSSMANSDCEFQHEGKAAITQETDKFHIEIAIFESGSVLSSGDCENTLGLSSTSGILTADLPLGRTIVELKLGESIYIRKPNGKDL